MFKCNKLLGAALAVVMGVSACATNVFAIDTSVIDEKWGKPTVVYGGGLTNDQIQSTRDLFDIKDTNNVYETSVDANDLYTYLGIAGGSTSSLISSVMVQKKDSGTGVKVKIITEDNITKITSNQYANAAITAGVSDVEIDVASVSKVTGESALTGVYKALESNGETLDLDRTQVAQDELETTNEIAENNADNSNFDSGRLDQAMVEIKKELAEIKQNQGSAATAEQVEQVVTDALKKFNLSDIISQDDINKLIEFAKKYQNTSAIDSQEVLKQLNKLSGSLKNQLSGLLDKAQSEGWFDKIINFIKSLFN
ncbi:DUF1002 domain-containing protein [uncultured Holdemanella sp.]|uniref:DUF1002 domain-containing protein n=1 Tax=uncultured Holdemanella sp. TaxID=1763549 RepID=UPI0025D564FA|nr:DUF1002 domain-containing protein [uncultured Holdemanella sp.]